LVGWLVGSLHDAIESFDQFISPTDAERRMRSALIANVISIVRQLWPSAMVVPFGSFVSGLFLPNRFVVRVVAAAKQSMRL
jgi:DNA polymerase sigma